MDDKYPLYDFMNTPHHESIFNNPPIVADFKAQAHYPVNDMQTQYNFAPLYDSPTPSMSRLWMDYAKIRNELFAPLEHIAYQLWYNRVPQGRLLLVPNGVNSKSIYIDDAEAYRVDIDESWNENIMTLTRKFAGFVGDGEERFNRILEEYGNE